MSNGDKKILCCKSLTMWFIKFEISYGYDKMVTFEFKKACCFTLVLNIFNPYTNEKKSIYYEILFPVCD